MALQSPVALTGRLLTARFAACFALTVLPSLSAAQLQPWVPIRLTNNGPGQYTQLAEGGSIDSVGFSVGGRRDQPDSFGNAFYLDNGRVVRLTENTQPGHFSGPIGKFSGAYVISSSHAAQFPYNQPNTAVNIVLRDGDSATQLTHNTFGSQASAHFIAGGLVLATREYDRPTGRFVREDVHAYTPAGTFNLTNNPVNHFAQIATEYPAIDGRFLINNSLIVSGPPQSNKSDLLLASVAASPAIALSNHPPGTFAEIQRFRAPDDVYFTSYTQGFGGRRDVIRFDGVSSTNLTNNGPRNYGSVIADAGPDLIFRREDESQSPETIDLMRWRGSVLSPMTANRTGESSHVMGTFGADVVYSSTDNGTSSLWLDSPGRAPLRMGPGQFVTRLNAGYVINGSNTVWLHDGASGSVSLITPGAGITHFVGRFRDGVSFNVRQTLNNATDVDNLFVFDGSTVHQLSFNTEPGTRSLPQVDEGDQFFFRRHRYIGSNNETLTDVFAWDGSRSTQITSVNPGQFARYVTRMGGDPVIELETRRPGEESLELVRYTPTGSVSLSNSEEGEWAHLISVDAGTSQAIWFETAPDQGFKVTGIYKGDGLSPPLTLFEPPPGMRLMRSTRWNEPAPLFIAYTGEGEQASSNILALLDDQLRPLTDNGPGWFSDILLPEPNFRPTQVSGALAIQLYNFGYERSDIVLVPIPEPNLLFAALAGLALRLKPGCRRGGL